MFPISCNAFSDIVVVVQLVRDIVSALNDARGAAEEYRQLVHILKALGTVIEEVYCLAKDSPNEGLKQAVLAEIRRVCDDISSATDGIAGYDRLSVGPARSSRGHDYPRQSLSKLRWHFLKASEADKYVRRFDESFHRLNAYIGILGHRSVSQMLTEQHEHALQTAQDQSRTVRESVDEIRLVALSAIQQASMQSRQRVAEQALARPFFPSLSQDRRMASRVQGVTDMIFDRIAPQTPAVQREQFLSLLAPFAVVGAAFVIHTNMDPRWRVPSLWAVVVALLVKVLWLRSSMPMHAGFSSDNAIILIDALGETVTVPFQISVSFELFHGFLDLLYTGTQRFGHEFVHRRLYELYTSGTSQLITADNWILCIHPGACIEMGVVLVRVERPDNLEISCPYCYHDRRDEVTTGDVTCSGCSRRFCETREDLSITTYAPSLIQREWNLDRELLSHSSLSDSMSAAQVFDGEDLTEQLATSERSRCGFQRVHVFNLSLTKTCMCCRSHVVSKYPISISPPVTPKDVEIGGQIYESLYGALLTDKNYTVLKDPRQYMSCMYSGLFCMFVETPEYLFPFKGILDVARGQHDTEKDKGIQGPMPVMGQLTLEMASLVDVLLTEPSPEYVHRWGNIFNRYSSDALSPDDTETWDWLFIHYKNASRVLRDMYAADR